MHFLILFIIIIIIIIIIYFLAKKSVYQKLSKLNIVEAYKM